MLFKDGNAPVTPVPALGAQSSKVKGFRAKRPLTFSLISIILYREGFSLPLSESSHRCPGWWWWPGQSIALAGPSLVREGITQTKVGSFDRTLAIEYSVIQG